MSKSAVLIILNQISLMKESDNYSISDISKISDVAYCTAHKIIKKLKRIGLINSCKLGRKIIIKVRLKDFFIYGKIIFPMLLEIQNPRKIKVKK